MLAIAANHADEFPLFCSVLLKITNFSPMVHAHLVSFGIFQTPKMHENEYPLVANSDSFLRELCMKLDHENRASHEKPPTLIKHDVDEMLEDDVDEQKNVTS